MLTLQPPTILESLIHAQQSHAARLIGIILSHAAHPSAETAEGGNSADLTELAAMREALESIGWAPDLDGLKCALYQAKASQEAHDRMAVKLAGLSGGLADLADLEEMRGLLDGWDWPQTPAGLSDALKMAEKADEYDKAHAKAYAEVLSLRAEVAALTPGPWLPMCDLPVGMAEPYQFCSVGAAEPMSPYQPPTHWRRFPAALLTLPEQT